MDEDRQVIEDEFLVAAGETPNNRRDGKAQPLYQMLGDLKIPVSGAMGKLWKARRDMGAKRMTDYHEAWDEAIAYYEHDHSGRSSQVTTVKGTRKKGDETENVVFSNISTLMPMLYSRAPSFEVTNTVKGDEEEQEDSFAVAIEQLVTNIFSRKTAPGINIKHRIRRATLFTCLCNISWLKLNWIQKDDSSEGVVTQFNEIHQQLQKAKNPATIKKLEGQLAALEELFVISEPAGPKLTFKKPYEIIVDPECEDPELSDAYWVMERDYLPTDLIRAKFLKDKGKEESILYHPTHVLRSGQSDNDDDSVMDAAFKEIKERDFKTYGFESEAEFSSASYTCVWWVWDKITRRVYLFHHNDWAWPLWVWDDPLRLSRFFPYFGLHFHESTKGLYGKGEVTYYLDQQDAINEINSQQAKARRQATTKVFYNNNQIEGKEIEKALNADDKQLIGVDVPEDMTMDRVIMSITPPNLRHKELFDINTKLSAIDRISGITDIMKGHQLRTNTVQDAVQLVADATQVRLDEKIDKIEELLSEIGWSLAELCVQFMTREDVEALIGSKYGKSWQNMTPKDFNRQYSFMVTAGSTEKPTSKVKQQYALDIAQVLGQFVNAAPAAILVILKLMEKAFTDVMIGEDDWALIMETLQAQMQKGISTQPNGAAGPAQSNGAPQQGASEFGNGDQIQELIANVVRMLPPEVKALIEQTVQEGGRPIDAILQALQQMSQ